MGTKAEFFFRNYSSRVTTRKLGSYSFVALRGFNSSENEVEARTAEVKPFFISTARLSACSGLLKRN